MQAVAEEHGCELPDDVIVSHGAQSAIGHESGSGEIPAGEPVIVDIWPRDQASRCYADMTRTFVAGGGEPPAELAEYWKLTQDSLDRVYADIRAGVNGRALFERSARALHRGRPADPADQGAGHDRSRTATSTGSGTASGSRSTSARSWAGSATICSPATSSRSSRAAIGGLRRLPAGGSRASSPRTATRS